LLTLLDSKSSKEINKNKRQKKIIRIFLYKIKICRLEDEILFLP
jgi:hypothetical protein